MKKYILLAAVCPLLFAAQSFASQGLYGAFGGGAMDFDTGDETIKPRQFIYRLGYDFNDYIGLGYEGGFSILEDDNLGADTRFIYVKGSLPVSESTSVYVLVGPATVERTVFFGIFSASVDDDDTGLGFGLETQLSSARIFIDYITYNDKNSVNVASVNLGVAFGF